MTPLASVERFERASSDISTETPLRIAVYSRMISVSSMRSCDLETPRIGLQGWGA